jgi:hypothetical protein
VTTWDVDGDLAGVRPGDRHVPPGDYRCSQPVVVAATVAYLGACVVGGLKVGLWIAEAILEARARRT